MKVELKKKWETYSLSELENDKIIDNAEFVAFLIGSIRRLQNSLNIDGFGQMYVNSLESIAKERFEKED